MILTKGHRDKAKSISVQITCQKLINKPPLYPAPNFGAETTLGLCPLGGLAQAHLKPSVQSLGCRPAGSMSLSRGPSLPVLRPAAGPAES